MALTDNKNVETRKQWSAHTDEMGYQIFWTHSEASVLSSDHEHIYQ